MTRGSRGSIGWGLIGGARGICKPGSWRCGCSCNGSSDAATCLAQMLSSALKLLVSDGNLRWVQDALVQFGPHCAALFL